MSNEELKKIITGFESSVEFSENKFLNITVTNDKFLSLATKLKENTETNFDYLVNITGVDNKNNLSCIYFLESTKFKHIVILRTSSIDRINPEIPTVSLLWKTADFQEREIWDLLGIRFIGHKDLRRIYLEEDWKGHPLRKDYVDEINIIER